MARAPNSAITRFIIDEIEEHPAEVTAMVIAKFGVTRATASNYVRRLVEDGLVEATGQTRAKRYSLKTLYEAHGHEIITPDTQDDEVWREKLLPNMGELNQNIRAICAYGFTEMFNNVIDHADSKDCYWMFERNAKNIKLYIRDHGIGIFEKIQKECALADHRQALFELSKGKLTTDKSRHTGEGIFFTSRAFDYFSITSMDLFYSRMRDDNHQWLIDWRPSYERVPGTMVSMEISVGSERKLEDVFSEYEDDDHSFSKTSVSIELARYALDQLVSRSQGKRMMARLEGFRQVLLDFANVESIGQAFADEVFRVFPSDHPDVRLVPLNINSQVKGMIDRAYNVAAREEEREPRLL